MKISNIFQGYKNRVSVLLTLMVLLLGGCGSEGIDPDGAGGGGFTFTGTIKSAGTPVKGASVKLYKSGYAIYSTSINGSVYYGSRNTDGVESVTLGPVEQTVTTNDQGVYSFAGLQSGKYTIQPVSGAYVYKWLLVPSRSDIGVITITESGMVYIYNPEGTGNKLSVDSSILYNTGVPEAVSGNIFDGLDFEATQSGGVGILF